MSVRHLANWRSCNHILTTPWDEQQLQLKSNKKLLCKCEVFGLIKVKNDFVSWAWTSVKMLPVLCVCVCPKINLKNWWWFTTASTAGPWITLPPPGLLIKNLCWYLSHTCIKNTYQRRNQMWASTRDLWPVLALCFCNFLLQADSGACQRDEVLGDWHHPAQGQFVESICVRHCTRWVTQCVSMSRGSVKVFLWSGC